MEKTNYSELEYWKKRCQLAEAYICESYCYPKSLDKEQVYNQWLEFKFKEGKYSGIVVTETDH